jgi:carotenoid cleavage dioxygenase-like enzyme
MKNITVGYTIPQILTRKAYIQKARVYFSADNLFFLYNGAGKYQLDPETTASAGYTSLGNGSVATYGRTTPQARSVSFGLQVTF